MKKNHYISLLLVALLALPSVVMAEPEPDPASYNQPAIRWNRKPNKFTGLYTSKGEFTSDGFSFGVHTLYYFGDVDGEGFFLNGGLTPNNIGGNLSFAYHQGVSAHCSMRYSLSAGMMRANNTDVLQRQGTRTDFRKFNSIFLQPAIGVEVYPINGYGFYLYGGVALNVSYILNYEFYYNTKKPVADVISGSTWGFLPMAQVGLGYSWNLPKGWVITVELLAAEGLIDMPWSTLDAYPLGADQNSKGVSLGSSFKHQGKSGVEISWNDGYYQAGITFTYRIQSCEVCRFLHNYQKVRR